MAIVEFLEPPQRRVVLFAHELIGRFDLCTFRVPHRQISSEHACLEWKERGWVIRDLGSRNGTYCDNKRLKPGVNTPLPPGAIVRLADDCSWKLIDASPPVTMAMLVVDRAGDVVDIRTAGRAPLCAENGCLALPPGDDNPPVYVYQTAARVWLAEYRDREQQLSNHDCVTAGDQVFRIHLPHKGTTTSGARMSATLSEHTEMRFDISADEEHVALSVYHGERVWQLKPRAYHYTLLTLARIRLRDQQDVSLSENSHGWVYQDDLLAMLRYNANRLHTDIYRARREFSALEIPDAPSVVERRPGARQLRLGVKRITISTL